MTVLDCPTETLATCDDLPTEEELRASVPSDHLFTGRILFAVKGRYAWYRFSHRNGEPVVERETK